MTAAWLMSLAAVVGAPCLRQRVRCPAGWYDYDGVRSTGEFTCAPRPVGSMEWGPRREDLSIQPPQRLRQRIYCTGGAHPVVDVDGLGVGCQR